MAFAAAIPQFWTASHSGQHLIVAVFCVAGLPIVTRIRPSHRFDYLDAEYCVRETLLWLGLYLSLNLQLSSVAMIARGRPDLANPGEFSRPFYSWAHLGADHLSSSTSPLIPLALPLRDGQRLPQSQSSAWLSQS